MTLFITGKELINFDKYKEQLKELGIEELIYETGCL